MFIIPLQPTPSQVVSVELNNQSCQINIYQKLTGLYCDLFVDNALIIGGVICQNLNSIVRDSYFGFIGDFCFLDNHGDTDPYYTGLGNGRNDERYSFLYLEPGEVL
jgi:hypothetical protein